MPGGSADAATFRRVEQPLAEHYAVVTYDPRGSPTASCWSHSTTPEWSWASPVGSAIYSTLAAALPALTANLALELAPSGSTSSLAASSTPSSRHLYSAWEP
jgi:hypothetical protein